MFRNNKCNHGQRGMCINCLVNKQKNTQKNKCEHPFHMKCLKCSPFVPSNNNNCNHPQYQKCSKCQSKLYYDTFAGYLAWLEAQCLHKKPCKKCVPPLSREHFKIDKNCKKHLPYPQGMCDSCMPPTLTLAPQKYSHVKRVIIKTSLIAEVVQCKYFGILLGKKKEGEIFIQDIYFPSGQIQGNPYFNLQIYEYDDLWNLFGLQQVGIFYNSPRIKASSIISSAICQLSHPVYQRNHQTSQFVCMRAQYNQQTEPMIECYMASDMLVSLFRQGFVFQNEKEDKFDLINAKSQDKSDLPTFLRNGIQTSEMMFTQSIVWITTSPEENYRQQARYPLFTIQDQSVQKLQQFIIDSKKKDVNISEYFSNKQFLLHMWRLMGKQKVMQFLQLHIFHNPYQFLDQMKQKAKKQIDKMINQFKK